ncbi:hypothetical protein [Alteromonas australica]|uniref:hypothetical protein n=1 Tax=Alteromonas australica TaxID=589873 RepID=UPI0023522090|nr:hypothetical protein [Alteromonas australica]|tara:strand:- start:7535 stop:9367 length:1833 start_codon:yes stop_codon:yes gene_type:complete
MNSILSTALANILKLLGLYCLLSCIFAAAANASSTEEDYSAKEVRRAQLMEWAQAKYKASNHLTRKPYWILGDTAVNGCKAEYSNYMVDFKNHSNDDGKTVGSFILPAIVRYLYQFEHCLSKQNIAVLQNYVAQGPCCENNEYLGHGTLNHAILKASSWYLLAQYFNKDAWIRKNKGKYTSKEIQSEIYDNLIARFNRHIQAGHFEMASPNYIEANFFPLLNLIDFAEDDTIRSLAEGEANMTLSYLKANSFKGKLIPPLTRQNTNELNSSEKNYSRLTYQLGRDKRLYWYYFGPELPLTLADFKSHKSPSLWVFYILSDWQPEILNFPLNTLSYSNGVTETEIPSFSNWGENKGTEIFSRSYIGENYALASSNVRYFPYHYSGELVEFGILVDSDNLFNQIDCTQPYWHSNYSVEINNKYKTRWLDRSSPFMQTYVVDKHNMLFIANIPPKDPFTKYNTRFTKTRSSRVNELAQFVRCRIPKGFDAIDKSDRLIKIKEGNTYIQIMSLDQIFAYENDDYYQYFTLKGGKSAMHFFVTDEVSSMAELSKEASQYNANFSPEKAQIVLDIQEQKRQIKMTYNNVLYKDSKSKLAQREILYESIPLIEEETK